MIRRSRRAFSTIILVAVLMALIAVVQLLQHAFSEQVTDQVTRDMRGLSAAGYASAALSEARARLVAQLNHPGTDAFGAARGPLPLRPIPLKISPADLGRVTDRMQQLAPGQFSLQSVSATLTPRFGLTTTTLTEYEGDLTVQAAVRGLLDRGLERALTSSWGFRLVNLAPEGPLRDVNLLIRRPDRVVNGRWNVQALGRKFVDTELPGLVQEVRKMLASLDQQKASNPDAGSAIDQIKSVYAPLVEGDGGGRIGRALGRVGDPFHALTPLSDHSGDYLLAGSGATVALAELNLQGDFDGLMSRYADVRAQVDRLGDQIRSQSGGQGPIQQYADALGQLAEVMSTSVARYLSFRNALAVVPSGTPPYDALARAYEQVSPIARLAQQPDLAGLDLRVSAILDQKSVTGPLEPALAQLFATVNGGSGPVQGIFMVQNPDRPLTLSGAFAGRFTLVVTGPLNIDGLTKTDPANDLFTIVQIASPGATLTLNGRVDATVIASGDRLTIRRGTQVLGGLFLEDVADSARIEPVMGGPEVSTRDTARSRLSADELRWLVLSPWQRATGSSRQLD